MPFPLGGISKRAFPGISLALPRAERRKPKKAEAGRFRAEGVKAGVPDLCLPVARGGYHGLYVELKRQAGGRTSGKQRAWLAALAAQGYCAAVCEGWEAAARVITEYLQGKKPVSQSTAKKKGAG